MLFLGGCGRLPVASCRGKWPVARAVVGTRLYFSLPNRVQKKHVRSNHTEKPITCHNFTNITQYKPKSEDQLFKWQDLTWHRKCTRTFRNLTWEPHRKFPEPDPELHRSTPDFISRPKTPFASIVSQKSVFSEIYFSHRNYQGKLSLVTLENFRVRDDRHGIHSRHHVNHVIMSTTHHHVAGWCCNAPGKRDWLIHWSVGFIGSSGHWFMSSLFHWLIASVINWFIGSLFHAFMINWFNVLSLHWLIGSMFCRFIDSLVPWFTDSLIHRLIHEFIVWFIDSLLHSFIDSLIGSAASGLSLEPEGPSAHAYGQRRSRWFSV